MLNKVCRTWFFWAAISAFALAVMTCLVFVDDADAATWRKSGEDLRCGGSKIYYVSSNPSAFPGGEKATITIYKKTRNSSPKKICSVKAYDVNLCGYYKKKLYYSKDAAGSMPGSLCVYNEKKKKAKRLVKHGYYFKSKGKYLIGQPNTGAWTPMNLYSVDMSTSKVRKITSSATDFLIKGSKVYYLQSSKRVVSNGNFRFRVMKCKLNSSTKKAVSKVHYGTGFVFRNSHIVRNYCYTASGSIFEEAFRF